MADDRDPFEPARLEIEVEPTVVGRLARWMERARILQARADAARTRHSSVELAFSLVERDSSLVLVSGAWLVVSTELPHGDVGWPALVPGALVFGVGLVIVNAFNVYVTTRVVEGRANTYGALGIATALLFSLVLVGRLIVVSPELNAALDDRREARF